MEIKEGDNFELDGQQYHCAELASHYWYCFALPINNPGPSKWFPREDMRRANPLTQR